MGRRHQKQMLTASSEIHHPSFLGELSGQCFYVEYITHVWADVWLREPTGACAMPLHHCWPCSVDLWRPSMYGLDAKVVVAFGAFGLRRRPFWKQTQFSTVFHGGRDPEWKLWRSVSVIADECRCHWICSVISCHINHRNGYWKYICSTIRSYHNQPQHCHEMCDKSPCIRTCSSPHVTMRNPGHPSSFTAGYISKPFLCLILKRRAPRELGEDDKMAYRRALARISWFPESKADKEYRDVRWVGISLFWFFLGHSSLLLPVWNPQLRISGLAPWFVFRFVALKFVSLATELMAAESKIWGHLLFMAHG